MIEPWSEVLRQALQAFRRAIVRRALREREFAEEAETRERSTEEHFASQKARIEEDYAAAQADALARAAQARAHVEEHHSSTHRQIEREQKQARSQHVKEYKENKAQLDAEWRDARWTTTTVFEADKRVAREQMLEAVASSKNVLKGLLAQWRTARKLIEAHDFLDDIPELEPAQIRIDDGDPWTQMQQCAEQAASDLQALQTLPNPRFSNGWLPWILLGVVWLLLSLPGILGFVLWPHPLWLLVAAAPVAVLFIGRSHINRVRGRTNERIIGLWVSLRLAAHRARKLRPACLRRARKVYVTRKQQSLKRNREVLETLVEKTRARLSEMRRQREKVLKKIDRTYEKHVGELEGTLGDSLRNVDTALAQDEHQAKERRNVAADVVGTEYERRREENHRWHTQEWTSLLRTWKSSCDQFLQTCRAIAREAEQWFPPLERPLTLPRSLPQGLPLGTMRWTPEYFPDLAPADPQLPTPDLTRLNCPALLPFPQRASLLLRAHDEGRASAIQLMQAILMRCWTSLPAGKVRCTIIDAVGRGENFSAFMHLADHDEKLVDGRIWTEPLQIVERLTNLTVHMENVLQKYLRNQFETLAEYNAQAGEVAEPFHFLVVAHFPVNFTEDAARRLVSLASAGARCGIYTIVLADTKQPMPHGFNITDLEAVCTILNWHRGVVNAPGEAPTQGGFAWEDEDFGMFPLEVEKLPPAQRCTELLTQIGEEAVRASKVEVPFEWIMPARPTWWQSDSGQGLRVAIGRFGAQGKQLLELGQGTSQHVLVAGKTGSGKSTLLHVVIAQLAMAYSPREVELYLVDFKKGVEFKAYASLSLPHARVIAIESEREFGLSVLQKLDAELTRRGELYRAAGVNDLASYREHAADATPSARKVDFTLAPPDGREVSLTLPPTLGVANRADATFPHLARIMLIVDEFQEFFIEDDRLAQEASLLLDRLVRQGRAFGMHVLLGSQTIGGAYSLARSTIDQMAVRIALQCSEADAHLILSRDNTEARLLARPGEGIYNAMHGLLEGNHLFQVVWLADAKRDELLRQVREMSQSATIEPFPAPIVFEGAQPADLDQNHLLSALRRATAKPTSTWNAWLGDAVAIKDPTAAVLRRQAGANCLILGQQEDIAISLTVAGLISLSAALVPDRQLPGIHLVIGHVLDAASEELVNLLTEVLPIRLWQPRELGTLLAQLVDAVEKNSASTNGQSGSGPQFLFLYGLQRMRDLRKPEDDFGFSKKGEEKTPFRLFMEILKDGPPAGIFTMLWCDTLVNLQRSIDRATMREFDQRVLMQMSAADSSTLIDSPIAAKLGPQRALYYTEGQGKVEKFRPYALPNAEWVRSLASDRTIEAQG